MRVLLVFVLAAMPLIPLQAAELRIELEIPRLAVAEYHRPYVAAWIARPDQSVAANLALWYDIQLRNEQGAEWLKDLRQWWRRSGRELSLPIDGVTGATRLPGPHRLVFTDGQARLGRLPPGDYQLQVEAVREVGGRELVTIPFQWPPTETQTRQVRGEHELGAVTLELIP